MGAAVLERELKRDRALVHPQEESVSQPAPGRGLSRRPRMFAPLCSRHAPAISVPA